MSEPTETVPSDLLESPAVPTPELPDPADEVERRTTSVELLWDLVFVFAITQITTLLTDDLSWAGFGRAMLVLALVWWAWSAFVWAANAQSPASWSLRGCLLVATVFIFIAGLAVPQAFGSEGTLFACTYAAVRFLHLALYADASRKGNAAWSAIAGFALTVVIGMALLIGGSFAGGGVRIALWVSAVAIDYAGPAWLTRERLRGLQRVAVAHFAERYSLFVMICLGESIVAIGVAARPGAGRHGGGHPLDAAVVVAVALGVLITIGMWWTYFDRYAPDAERRLREHSDPVLAAADGYSYLHLVIVAGIITFAVGVKVLARGAISSPLATSPRLALCCGVALYLLGNAAFRMRMSGEIGYERLIVALAATALFAVGGGLPAWVIAAVLTVLLAGLCWFEIALPRRLRGEGS